MRIGLSTSAFGSVEVKTVVHANNEVGLTIGSEKGDLHALLQNDMPAITGTLQEQNLHLHTVNYMQGFAFSNSAGGGSSQQQRYSSPPRAGFAQSGNESVQNAAEMPTSAAYSMNTGSLSILA